MLTDGEVISMLRNVGVDVNCGACMEVAFTGVTTNAHECQRPVGCASVSTERSEFSGSLQSAAQKSSSQIGDPSSSSAEERVKQAERESDFVIGFNHGWQKRNERTDADLPLNGDEAHYDREYTLSAFRAYNFSDSRVPTGGEPEQENKDHGAGLIHQVASPLAETEPRPNCGHPDSVTGACVKCGHDRTVCADCGIDVAASGVGGGSWAPFGHQCKPVVCGEMSGFGDREWYACRRPKGHTDAHRNKSGFAWISASNKIGSGKQPLSETSGSNAQERSAKETLSPRVPSLPSADGSIAQAKELESYARNLSDTTDPCKRDALFQRFVEALQAGASALRGQSEAQQEKEQKEHVGGHVSHGGRDDLGPADRPELPHDGVIK